jgi:hypothetical protein
MSHPQAILFLIGKLISFAVILQSIEFISIRKSLTESGIWRWSELRTDYLFLPGFFLKGLDFIMNEKAFTAMMILRIVFAIALIDYNFSSVVYSLLFLFLFTSTFLITVRWRGSFNGGSDYLLLIILLSIIVGSINPNLATGAIWYISLQVASSYFLAGLHKVRREKWWRGIAVGSFVNSPNYSPPAIAVKLLNHSTLARLATWGVLIFELTFPLALINIQLCKFYLLAGLIFHLSNFFIFGLNRFFWIWTASYPALWYCCYSLSTN